MKRETKKKKKVEKGKHQGLLSTLTSFDVHRIAKKCFQRSSTFPLVRIDTVYRVPKMSRESVGAWKNIRLGDRKRWSMNCTRVSAYMSEIYFLIRGCALGRSRWFQP